ncbi:hypothetical protein DFH11DRAFT_1730027 [Phellopilus nigrolimitatus]|nr:hypothetical protein DFH11DRAFT_1730027 [Phellopilus nigrolimitatus]
MSGIWTEHRNAEGRTYWFNTSTKESVWEKPEALKSPFEKALGQTQWKEYFSGGRKYYYNTDTKESKWDMPDELLLLLEKVEKENKPVQQAANPRMIAPNFAPGQLGSQGASVPLGGIDPSLPQSQQPLNGAAPNPLAVGAHTGGIGGLPFTPSNVLPGRPSLPDDPVIPHNGFATLEEGEKAFTHLLRKGGHRCIALNTLAEKKNCWQKYVDGLKEKEREEREARLAKIRPAIRNMLKGNPNVFHYSTFQSADRLFAQHPIWQQAKIESERKMIFEEYVAELKQREVQESRAVRARSVGKVVALFKELNVDVLTRWRTAYSALRDSDAWATDPELQRLPSLDVLLAFEDYARVQEREFEDRMRRETVEKARRDRKGREAFKSLLRELVDAGRIRAKSKWKDVYPDFGDDERYLGLLGIPGSNPLELFWDVVDSLDQKLDAKVTVVEEAIRKSNEQAEQSFEFGPNTTEEEFFAAVAAAQMHHEDLQSLDKDDLNEIYDFMHSDLVKRLESERRRAERKQRHMQDDFRYALKKLSDPIDVNASYDDAIPLMENLPEYKALEDEGRRAAFSKFIKRQKVERLRERELSEDGGSTTSRKRKEPSGREKDGDRDREYRDYDREDGGSGRSSRHHRRGHDADYDVRRDRDRDYKDRDRDREGAYKSRYREHERERSGRDKSERDRDRAEREDRRREDKKPSRVDLDRDFVEDPRYAIVHEGGVKREHDDKSVYSDRSEKRARYDSLEPPRSAPPVREETPEEGEI